VVPTATGTQTQYGTEIGSLFHMSHKMRTVQHVVDACSSTGMYSLHLSMQDLFLLNSKTKESNLIISFPWKKKLFLLGILLPKHHSQGN
jgi:hypothetical protein